MTNKKCARCEQIKESHAFSLSKKAKTRLSSWCIDCMNEYCKSKYKYVPVKPRLISIKESHKICRKCSEEKPFSDFSKNDKIKCGLNSWCKKCVSEYQRTRPKKNYYIPKEPKEQIPEGFKKCTTCLIVLSATLEHFRPNPGGKYGLESKCRPCFLEGQRFRRNRDKDTINKRNRERRVRKGKNDKRRTRWLVDGQEPTHKDCGGPCGLNKPLSDFNIKSVNKNTGKTYYRSFCKACISEQVRLKRINDPEKYQERQRKKSLKKKAERETKLALLPKPKDGHKFCKSCKIEKPATLEFFGSVNTPSGISARCKICLRNSINKTPKHPRSDKDGYRICIRCVQELTTDQFKTTTGNVGLVCISCRKNDKSNTEKFFNGARSRLRSFLFSKSELYSDEIGCINTDLKKYIEAQFKTSMNWHNHGTYWHLDHYYPLSKAFKISPEVYAKALHYTNIRPTKTKDNLIKNAKIPKEFKNIEDFLNKDADKLKRPEKKSESKSLWD
jgi:hypothetical protein